MDEPITINHPTDTESDRIAEALRRMVFICEVMRQIDANAGDAKIVKTLAASAIDLIEDCGAGLEGLPTE